MLSHSQPNPSLNRDDIHQLQQLLLSETEQKERALARVDMLEAEIRALKNVLASQAKTPAAVANTNHAENNAPIFNSQLILVVDDQPLNLDLVEALLEDVQLEIVCLTSAQEALEFMRIRRPDLILMDIQMPGMDGYEATAKIRADLSSHQPIILAMTANNSPEDTQRSFAAGMQGHLCKPIDANVLFEQLNTWLNNSPVDSLGSLSVTNAPSNPNTANTTPDLDEWPGIDLAGALVRLRGNRSLLEEVLISFADKAALIIPELQQANLAQDLDGATRILHRLKGTSANLSAVHVSPLAARLETQCKNGQLPSDAELAELEAAIAELIATANTLNKPANPEAMPTDSMPKKAVQHSEIQQCLARISEHLNNDLGQAEDAVETLLHLCQHTPHEAAAIQLRTMFYQFNLRAVQALISNGFEQAHS